MFPVPTFPVKCNIWYLADNETSVWPNPNPPALVDFPCQIASPLNLQLPDPFETYSEELWAPIIIRLPAGTLVRDGLFNTSGSARGFGDQIEVPSGSGIAYGVVFKITVGRGYPNEHVRCICVRITKGTRAE